MKTASLFALALSTACVLHAADAGNPATLPDPVAVVDGANISRSDVEAAINTVIARAGKRPEEVSDDMRLQLAQRVVNDMIGEKLIEKSSSGVKIADEEVDARYKQLAAKFSDPAQLEAQMKASGVTEATVKTQLRESMRERKWVNQQIADKVSVSDKDAEAFYKAHPELFKKPEMVRASHIFIGVDKDAKPDVVAEKQKAIEAAADRISKGEAFEKVAKEVSEDKTTADKGGDLNFFPRTGSPVPEEFADAAFALKPGEVSKPVRTQLGFHLIKQTGHQDPTTVSLEQAKPKLLAYMEEQQRQQAVSSLIAQLRAKADVKNNLPPEAKSQP